MRVDIREDEVNIVLCGFFASAVEAYELDIVARTLILTPLDIAPKLEIDVLFNEGSGPAGAGAEVNEGVGGEGAAKEGAERGGKNRGSGGRLEQRELKGPELGQGGLDAQAEERGEPAL